MLRHGRDLGPFFFYNNQKNSIGSTGFETGTRYVPFANTHTRTHSFGFRPVRHLNTIGVACDIESSVRADNKAAL